MSASVSAYHGGPWHQAGQGHQQQALYVERGWMRAKHKGRLRPTGWHESDAVAVLHRALLHEGRMLAMQVIWLSRLDSQVRETQYSWHPTVSAGKRAGRPECAAQWQAGMRSRLLPCCLWRRRCWSACRQMCLNAYQAQLARQVDCLHLQVNKPQIQTS